ncbi:hypothetical protein SS50377_25361 [Spironucleus salmonicida]|uniref:Uncharacterized protein n=1 Tax=Spironucleus salmonicida TaxID=348837 RepID=V6LBH4_9EUKA|nr:hypothetical protein SS50377_25361 [Spironucleus salmonicida]|eukprot:EST41762.1 hypothetical protein SS50377_18595 [Spironucleus salmonicida]
MSVLLNLEIVISPTQKAVLQVQENKTPKQLAINFVDQYQLNLNMINPLAVYISEQVQLLDIESSNQDFYEYSSTSSVEQPTAKEQLAYSRKLANLDSTSKPNIILINQQDKQKQHKNANSMAFNRLYADAIRRKQKKLHQNSPKNKKLNLNITQQDFIYEKSVNFLQQKEEKLQFLRKQVESERQRKIQEEMDQCTFQPIITGKAQLIMHQKDVFSRLADNEFMETRKQETFQQVTRQSRKQETFKPQINYNYPRCKSRVRQDQSTQKKPLQYTIFE